MACSQKAGMLTLAAGASIFILLVMAGRYARSPYKVHRISPISRDLQSQGWNNTHLPSTPEAFKLPKSCNLTSSAARLQTLDQWCGENGFHYRLLHTQNVRESFKDVYVNEKYKIMYCHIPKTGCTNWKKYFILLSNRTQYTEMSQIRGSDAHAKLFDDTVKTLSEFAAADRAKILQTYYKFLFVRHPLTRLLSAYRNKFEKTNPTFEWFRQKIFIYNDIDPNSEEQLTFTHFLRYLTDPEGKNMHVNEHWQSYQELCHPCRIRYDYIGHVETMTEDVKQVLKELSAPYKFPTRQSSSDRYVTQYYSSIASGLLDRVIQRYSDDIQSFGYNCEAT